MEIRRAGEADLDAVMAVVRKVVPAMRAAGNQQWDDTYPNLAVFRQDLGLGQLWVAAIHGTVAGVAAITTDQEPGYVHVGWNIDDLAIVVHRLAVDPDFQGRGIAAALMTQAEAVARERSIPRLRVDTNSENAAIQRLLPKLGYVFAGETTFGFRPGLRFLCYEKQLQLDL